MSSRVIVVVAHPDDEILGCGGTIVRHVESGDVVKIIFVADGVTSRENKESIAYRRGCGIEASKIVGACLPKFLDFPDNQLDSIPLLEVVKAIENEINDFSPEVVYTHFSGDLNIDHSIVHRAVMTAVRPLPKSCIKEIYSFEVVSSTGWLPSSSGSQCFDPNLFVDISNTFDKKILALQVYDSEMREFPHSRSYKNVESLAIFRGASVGFKKAEGFQVERMLWS